MTQDQDRACDAEAALVAAVEELRAERARGHRLEERVAELEEQLAQREQDRRQEMDGQVVKATSEMDVCDECGERLHHVEVAGWGAWACSKHGIAYMDAREGDEEEDDGVPTNCRDCGAELIVGRGWVGEPLLYCPKGCGVAWEDGDAAMARAR